MRTLAVIPTICTLAVGLTAFGARGEAFAQATSETRNAAALSVLITYNLYTYVDGVKIFYRAAGPANGPAIFLPHGFPRSSYTFRNLILVLADRYHVIAPDYPGFNLSAAPDHTKCAYTFACYATLINGLLGTDK